MTEKRFPNSEEIAALKAKGVLAISNLSCRLCAGLALIFFLINTDTSARIREMLSVQEISDPIILEAITSLFRSLSFAVMLYLLVFVVVALFQSKFYFQIGRAFKRQASFFELKRAFSFFKITELLSILLILLMLGISMLIWKELFLSTLGLIEGSGFAKIPVILMASALNLVNVIFVIISILIITFVIYSKLSFRMRHKVVNKK